MRYLVFSLFALIGHLNLGAAHAFEIEDRVVFRSQSETQVLKILSVTDLADFQPLIKDFQRRNPNVTLDYTQVSGQELYKAISEQQQPFDVAISFAMDLQMKLANDGLAQPYSSKETLAAPDWSRWKQELFGFTAEPIAVLASRDGFTGLEFPKNRQELISILRDNPARFTGRVGTYDVRTSGSGYMLGTQDAHQSETYWRLAEVMGSLRPKLYCCSSEMIEDIKSGNIFVAYNVLESYARSRLSNETTVQVIRMEDFTHVVLRSALIPVNAESPELGGAFIDYLISPSGQMTLEQEAGLPPLSLYLPKSRSPLRSIRFGVTLITSLDRLARERFISAWEEAMRAE